MFSGGGTLIRHPLLALAEQLTKINYRLLGRRLVWNGNWSKASPISPCRPENCGDIFWQNFIDPIMIIGAFSRPGIS